MYLHIIPLLVVILSLYFSTYRSYPTDEAISIYNNANNLHRASHITEALDQYSLALSISWDFAQAHQNIACILDSLGNYDQAKLHHQYSIDYAPDDHFKIAATLNLLRLELKLPSFDAVTAVNWISRCQELLLLQPYHAEVLFLAGTIHRRLGNTIQSLSIFQMIVESVQPSFHLAWLNIGNHYFHLHNFTAAIENYLQALQYVPKNDKNGKRSLMVNLAQSYREKGELKVALLHFQQAQQLSLQLDDIFEANVMLSNIFIMKTFLNDFSNFETVEFLLTQAIIDTTNKNLIFQNYNNFQQVYLLEGLEMVYDPYTFSLFRFLDEKLEFFIRRSSCPRAITTTPNTHTNLKTQVNIEIGKIRKGSGLKVGYLSYDWRDHPMGRLTANFVTETAGKSEIDTKTRDFEIEKHCFSYGYNDNSTVRHFITTYTTNFHDVAHLTNDHDIAGYIAKQNIDVLVDLQSHTFGNRIGIVCRQRNAFVIINYLGFPGHSTCSHVDFTMVDKHIMPPDYDIGKLEDVLGVEKKLYLPFCYQANYMPLMLRRYTPQAESVGAPGKFNVCVLNANKKFDPLSWQTWMNIMQINPMMQLLLLDVAKNAKQMILLQAAFYGVLRTRITFLPKLPWEQHLARAQHLCSLALDTFTYGAHTTATDLLWMGVPIIALRGFGISQGKRMPSRVAASIIENIGDSIAASSLIQDSIKQYEESVTKLLTHQTSLLFALRQRTEAVRCESPVFHAHLQSVIINRAYLAAMEERSLQSRTKKRHHLILTKQNLDFINQNYCQEEIQRQLSTDVEMEKEKAKSVAWHGNLTKAFQNDGPLILMFSNSLIASSSNESFLLDRHYRCEELSRDEELTEAVSSSHLLFCLSLSSGLLSEQREVLLLSYRHNYWRSLGKSQQVNFFHELRQHFALSISSSSNEYYRCDYSNIISLLQYQWELMLENDFICELRDLWIPCLSGKALHFPAGNNSSHTGYITTIDWSQFIGDDEHQLRSDWSQCLSEFSAKSSDKQMSSLIMAEAYLLQPKDLQLLMNTALLFYQAENGPWSYLLIAIAVRRIMHYRSQQNFQYRNKVMKNVFTNITEKPKTNTRIAIYCHEYGQEWWPGWGPASFPHVFPPSAYAASSPSGQGKAAGGSEEAVAYIAKELMVLGFEVFLFVDALSEEEYGYTLQQQSNDDGSASGSVTWLLCDDWSLQPQHAEFLQSFDVFIAWRYAFSLTLASHLQVNNPNVRFYLWLHDLVPYTAQPPIELAGHFFHGILVQSDFHQRFIANQYQIDDRNRVHVALPGETKMAGIHILPNGLPDSAFAPTCGLPIENAANWPNVQECKGSVSEISNDENVFIYASDPRRGLQQILEHWPQIKANLSNASFHIYYGFTEQGKEKMRLEMGHEGFDRWFRFVTQHLMQQDGVFYHGAVDHIELAKAYHQAGFFLYPSSFPETGCIAMMRAMAAGAIPITSLFQDSVLAALGGKYDLGPVESPLTGEIKSNPELLEAWLREQWTPAVIKAASEEAKEARQKLRMEMKQMAREKFHWRNSAEMLSTIIQESSKLQ